MAGVIWDELDDQHENASRAVPEGVPPSLLKYVPGELIWNESGCVYVSTKIWALDESNSESGLFHDPRIPLSQLARAFSGLPEFQDYFSKDCVFLDTETTGLGFTSLPFMIGVGSFETQESLKLSCGLGQDPQWDSAGSAEHQRADVTPTHFVVRQLFAPHPSHESAVLQHLQDLLSGQSVCVSFNGDSFDIPLIRARYEMNQFHFPELPLEDPFKDGCLISLDLLPLARKIWRKRIGSCALGNCENRILGLKRTHADVEGALIPGIYSKYLYNGKVDQVSRVFYHNRQDIASMSLLLKVLAQSAMSISSGSTVGLHGEEALSMGTAMLRESRWTDAERLLSFATRALNRSEFQATAFKELALFFKRQERWQEATDTWQRWISTPTQDCEDPYVELAKYYEWREKDISQADMYTRWALHVNGALPNSPKARRIRKDLEHRLRRLERKG